MINAHLVMFHRVEYLIVIIVYVRMGFTMTMVQVEILLVNNVTIVAKDVILELHVLLVMVMLTEFMML